MTTIWLLLPLLFGGLVTPELQPLPAMDAARSDHTMTTLPDGRVLVFGGMGGGGASIFDPIKRAFLPVDGFGVTRHSHTATKLEDGSVLITGGFGPGGDYLDTAKRFDPSSNAFVEVKGMTESRANHLAIRLQDGQVLLMGGTGAGWTFLSSAEIYDPASGAFLPAGSMSIPRQGHAAILLDDGRVMVTGGHRGRRANMIVTPEVDVYDPGTNKFYPNGTMTIRRHKHDMTRLPDGRVLISGGANERDGRGAYRSMEVYDPLANSFVRFGDLIKPRYKHAGTTVVLSNGNVLFVGGADQAEVLDPVRLESRLVPGGPLGAHFPASAVLDDGRVLITGGYGPDVQSSDGAWLWSENLRLR